MKRRKFITLLGGVATWPLAARAQQQAPIPVIGLLFATSPDANQDRLRAFQRGLKESGYVDGENVVIVNRSANGQYDRLPTLAAELVRQPVGVICATSELSASAAKAATTTIPIVFLVGADPVNLGLVASIARPEGNVTGVNFVSGETAKKQLELLRELLPDAVRLAVLVNPNSPLTETTLSDLEAAARVMGRQIQVFRASTSREIEATFAGFARERPDALFVGADPFFTSRRVQLANLASRHAVPMTSYNRELTDAGGLMSYGGSIADAYYQIGIYAGRILKGAKPTDLPVMQASRLGLVINTATARMLGLTVPDKLLATADEVIE
jgi:putative tryptophan/tyrosine transport system substrate-binding protein